MCLAVLKGVIMLLLLLYTYTYYSYMLDPEGKSASADTCSLDIDCTLRKWRKFCSQWPNTHEIKYHAQFIVLCNGILSVSLLYQRLSWGVNTNNPRKYCIPNPQHHSYRITIFQPELWQGNQNKNIPKQPTCGFIWLGIV